MVSRITEQIGEVKKKWQWLDSTPALESALRPRIRESVWR